MASWFGEKKVRTSDSPRIVQVKVNGLLFCHASSLIQQKSWFLCEFSAAGSLGCADEYREKLLLAFDDRVILAAKLKASRHRKSWFD
jgi:hypothetical protein